MTPAEQWAAELAAWAIPQSILDQAPESPWLHDPAAFAADDTMARDSVSALRAIEALGGTGSVLDVGCGGGRSSLALVPPAFQITGVDSSSSMLSAFREGAQRLGAEVQGVEGRWPEVADRVGDADVVVCHHVLYNVSDIEPFVRALDAHARQRVVVELTTAHPQSVFAPAWWHFWAIHRPTRPTADQALETIRSFGFDAQLELGPRPPMARAASDMTRQVPSLRRRLCLPADRDNEVERWLVANPVDAGNRQSATIWWDVVHG